MVIEIFQHDIHCVSGGVCYCWAHNNILAAGSNEVSGEDGCKQWCYHGDLDGIVAWGLGNNLDASRWNIHECEVRRDNNKSAVTFRDMLHGALTTHSL